MAEQVIQVESKSFTALYGVNNEKIDFFVSHFPKVRVIVRGEEVKLKGEPIDIDLFKNKFNELCEIHSKVGELSFNQIADIVGNKTHRINEDSDVIVHGNSGYVVRARSENQKKMVAAIRENDMLFAIGPAGTGKTYTAVALAVKALKNKEVRKIILTRPAVEAGENLGFLPGDLKDKLDPYLQPLYDALQDMLPPEKLSLYLENGTIQIAPLAYMRGRTLDNAFVILDEAQNSTETQLKMFLTRMGRSAKFVITGDVTQIDLPRHQKSGLVQVRNFLKDIQGITFIELGSKDIVRHELVERILNAYNDQE